MIRNHLYPPVVVSGPPAKARLAAFLLLLFLGLAGCKEKENATSREAKTEAPNVRQTTSESATSTPLSASGTSSEPDPGTPSNRPPADLSAAEMSGQVSVPVQSEIGSPADSAKSANSRSAGKRSPQVALAAAKKYQESATNLARQGKLEPAYKAAVEGWQMVRIHPSDPNCKKVAAELLEDIRNYSDQLAKAAGGEAGMPNDFKPIRFE